MGIRTGRLSRLARLGGMAAGVAGGAAGLAGGVVRGSGERAMEAFHRRTAERLADALGEMKGLPHKVGQILSVMDATIPVEHRAIYGEVLSRLQAETQALPWSEVAPVVEDGLGVSPDVCFAEVDPEPVAAASIGQVHRGRLHDGRTVAVKVQYPGVAAALQADLDNADALVASLGTVVPKTDVRALIDDLTTTFLEELDYAHEARVQAACAARWADDADIVIPAVIPACSGDRVLTTEWVDGMSFTDARTAPTGQKDRWGAALWRFTWTSITEHGWVHGDPHPGNLRFLPDGRLAVLDFGASATLPAVLHEGLAAGAEAARAGASDAVLLRHVLPAVGLPLDLAPDVARPWAAFSRLLFAPMASTGPFRFRDSYLQSLVREVRSAKTAAARTALWKGMPTPSTAGAMLVMRTAVGQAALLAHLEASVDG